MCKIEKLPFQKVLICHYFVFRCKKVKANVKAILTENCRNKKFFFIFFQGSSFKNVCFFKVSTPSMIKMVEVMVSIAELKMANSLKQKVRINFCNIFQKIFFFCGFVSRKKRTTRMSDHSKPRYVKKGLIRNFIG